MSTTNEVSLFNDADWAILLPTNTVQIGTVLINVTPLTLKDFSIVSSKTIYLIRKLKQDGLLDSAEGISSNLNNIVPVVLREAPEILKILTKVPVIDLVRLPINKVLELVSAAFDVNTRDQEALEKNLESLAGLLNMITGGVHKIVEPSQAQE